MTQIFLAFLATFSAIASAVAAWKSQSSAKRTLDFQKRISQNQNTIFLLHSTLENLWRLKRIIIFPYEVSDEEYQSIDRIYDQIKINLDQLTSFGFLIPDDHSNFFNHEKIGSLTIAITEIDREMKILQKKLAAIYL